MKDTIHMTIFSSFSLFFKSFPEAYCTDFSHFQLA